jgi:aminopeptidase N
VNLLLAREGMAAPMVRRLDYTAPAFWIRHADLTFDLDGAKTLVASRLSIERNPQGPGGALVLQGEDITLLRCMIDGQSVSFRHGEDGSLIIDNPPAADTFTLELRNTCFPEKNTQLSGLYASGSGLFTQCEAEGFRRITYFADRPDVMATFSVTLRADAKKYPVLLSNGNLVEQGSLDGGKHFAKWHDPFPKPSYLFALVAADLVSREQRIRSRAGNEHLLQIYVRRGDLDKTDHAMRSLMASIAWDEARFGLPLDLERFMIVAVEDFNMGAMENKGLNIFNTKFVLANAATATDLDFANVEAVIGHEYFHNWTGNRITCRDWFQLSLKEGLTVFRDQEFSMDMTGDATARAVKRIEDVRNLRAHQFPEDAGTMAHPVRPDSYAAIDNFYTTTIYEKGAEVVRMMQTLVGRDGFRRGMDLYFQRHDGQAVTCDDFAQAMADANPDSALASRLERFKRWYAQAGTPRLTARSNWDAASGTFSLTLSQSTPPTPGQSEKLPVVIPVRMGLISVEGQALPLTISGETTGQTETLLVLDEVESTWVFEGLSGLRAAPIASLLRGFSAPVILDDGLGAQALQVLLSHDTDAFNRWEAGQRLMLETLLAGAGADDAAGTRFDASTLAALRSVLRHPELDPALKEAILTLPSAGFVAERMTGPVDPQRIHIARETLRAQLAQDLAEDWTWAWQVCAVREGYEPSAAQSGRRALAGLALHMLCREAARTGDTVWPGRAYQRVKDAGNMTERLAALTALVDNHLTLAEPALQRFHQQFRDEALVLDKWFMLQARAPEPLGAGTGQVFQRIKSLMHHPDFTLRNPNRARSLLTSLFMFNPAAFHRSDAAGYVFWAERIVELDGFNPQIAARLARSLDRWSALAEPWRSAAREALTRVAAKGDLSANTREIVSHALA